MSLLRVCTQKLLSAQRINCSYSISTVCINKQKNVIPETKKEDETASTTLERGKHHKVNNLERKFLVWTGKYKTVEEVPLAVSQGTMEKARNKIRIKIANYMMLATVLLCVGFVYSGKQAAKRGESVQKMNLDWHKQINEANSTK